MALVCHVDGLVLVLFGFGEIFIIVYDVDVLRNLWKSLLVEVH